MLHFHGFLQDKKDVSGAIEARAAEISTSSSPAAMCQPSYERLSGDGAPSSVIPALAAQDQAQDLHSTAVELGSLPLSVVHEQLDTAQADDPVACYLHSDAVSHADSLAVVPYVHPSAQATADTDLAALLTQLQPYVLSILNNRVSSFEAGFEERSPSHLLADSLPFSHCPDGLAVVPYVQPHSQAIAGMNLATLLTQLQPFVHSCHLSLQATLRRALM